VVQVRIANQLTKVRVSQLGTRVAIELAKEATLTPTEPLAIDFR
jgi:hypothetical protein